MLNVSTIKTKSQSTSNISLDVSSIEGGNKENEPHGQTPKWYQGAIAKPVAFKSTRRRSSHN